jgi:predicted nucleic acid-binding protein
VILAIADSNCVIRRLFPSQGKPAPGFNEFYDKAADGEATLMVPDHFFYEMANYLQAAAKQGAFPHDRVAHYLDLLNRGPCKPTSMSLLMDKHVKAIDEGLVEHGKDAPYVALAMLTGRPLFTTDRELAKRMRRSGMAVIA